MFVNSIEKSVDILIENILMLTGFNILNEYSNITDLISYESYLNKVNFSKDLIVNKDDVIGIKYEYVDFMYEKNKKCNVNFTLLFLVGFDGTNISDIKVNIEKINLNRIYDIYIFDFLNSLVNSLYFAFNQVRDVVQFVTFDNKKYYLDKDMAVEVEVVDLKKFFINALLSTMFFVKYNIDIDSMMLERIKNYSYKLYDYAKNILKLNDTITDDIYKYIQKEEKININQFTKDFNYKYINKEMYNKTDINKCLIENYIIRNKMCNIIDLLILLDNSNININSFSFFI